MRKLFSALMRDICARVYQKCVEDTAQTRELSGLRIKGDDNYDTYTCMKARNTIIEDDMKLAIYQYQEMLKTKGSKATDKTTSQQNMATFTMLLKDYGDMVEMCEVEEHITTRFMKKNLHRLATSQSLAVTYLALTHDLLKVRIDTDQSIKELMMGALHHLPPSSSGSRHAENVLSALDEPIDLDKHPLRTTSAAMTPLFGSPYRDHTHIRRAGLY